MIEFEVDDADAEDRAFVARRRIRRLRAYDALAVSFQSATHTGDDSRVQQQFGNEVDINTIVRRFSLTQQALPVVEGGIYGDFTGVTDFESAVEVVERAEKNFMQLPAALREKFGHSTVEFMKYAQSVPEATLFAELGLTPAGTPAVSVQPSAAADAALVTP